MDEMLCVIRTPVRRDILEQLVCFEIRCGLGFSEGIEAQRVDSYVLCFPARMYKTFTNCTKLK